MTKISLLGIFAVGALAFLGDAHAAALKNDKFSAAANLTGLSGEVSTTNAEATAERGEEQFIWDDSMGASIWYRYTVPTEGFLIITLDESTSEGGYTDLGIFTGSSIAKLEYVGGFESNYVYDSDADAWRQVYTIPVRQGMPLRFRFDSYGNPGEFNFSYKLVTGGAFKCVNAPYSGSTYGQPWNEEWVFNETAGTVQVTVARLGSTTGSASVAYRVSHDTTSTADFAGTPEGTLNFAPGETHKTVQIPLVDDGATELQEQFYFELEDASPNATILSGFTSMYIDSNDATAANDAFSGAIELTGGSGMVATPSGVATLEAGEPPILAQEWGYGVGQSLWYEWTATENGILHIDAIREDFDLGTVSLPIAVFTGAALDELKIRELLAGGDYSYPAEEPRANASLYVKAGTTYYIAVLGHFSGTFALSYSLEDKSVFRIKRTNLDAYESEGALPVTIERLGSTSGQAGVTFSTQDGTMADDSDSTSIYRAKAGEDYLSVNSNLTFEDGEAEKTVDVVINSDSKREKWEYFKLLLSNPTSDNLVDSEYSTERGYIGDGRAPTGYSRDLVLNDFDGDNWFGVLTKKSGPAGLGSVTVSMHYKGTFTGFVMWEGKKAPFKGEFSPSTDPADIENGALVAEVTIPIPRGNLPALSVTLKHTNYGIGENLEYSSFNTTLSGEVSDGVSTSEFTAYVIRKYKASQTYSYPVPTSGVYTMALAPDTNITADVRQKGVASINIKPTGIFKLTGTLPDGTKISGGGIVGEQLFNPASEDYRTLHVASLYIPLYKGAGQFAGTVRLGYISDALPPPNFGDGEGSFSWVRPELAQSTGPAKPAFSGVFTSIVSRYRIFPDGTLFAGTQPVDLVLGLSEGGLVNPLSASVSLNKLVATVTSTIKAKLAIKRPTGLFKGSFTPPDGKSTPHHGVILQNLQQGHGFFLNGGTAGKVELSEP